VGKRGTVEEVASKLNTLQSEGLLNRKDGPCPYPLLLETAAGQGTELGKSWEELRHLYEALDKSSVGICVDTQHAYAAGMSPLSDHESVVSLFDTASDICSSGISLIHLNDSARAYSSRVDRHAPLTRGYIWNREREGLLSLVCLSRDMALDLVLETGEIADLSTVASLAYPYRQ
jgi:endonuclease IV